MAVTGLSPRTHTSILHWSQLYGSNLDKILPEIKHLSSFAHHHVFVCWTEGESKGHHDCQSLKRTKKTITLCISTVEVVHKVCVLSIFSWCVNGILSALELGSRDLDELLMWRFIRFSSACDFGATWRENNEAEDTFHFSQNSILFFKRYVLFFSPNVFIFNLIKIFFLPNSIIYFFTNSVLFILKLLFFLTSSVLIFPFYLSFFTIFYFFTKLFSPKFYFIFNQILFYCFPKYHPSIHQFIH